MTVMTDQKLELSRTQEEINQGLLHFNSVKDELEALAQACTGLKIQGLEDKSGMKKVAEARKTLKAKRVELTKQGKSMRDGLTAINRFISSKEKELVGIIEPIEDELQAEEDRIEEERQRIAREEEERENARIQARVDKLLQYGRQVDIAELRGLSDETFDLLVDKAREEWEAEQEEKRKAEEARLAEERRIAEEREQIRIQQEELDRERQRMREQQEAIEAEKRKIEEQKQAAERAQREAEEAKRRADELEKAKAEAAEKARLEAIAEQQRQEEERKAAEEKKRLAEERKAARQPDKVKLQKYLIELANVVAPEMKTDDGQRGLKVVKDKLAEMLEQCKTLIEQM